MSNTVIDGLLALAETSIMYIDDRSDNDITIPLDPATQFVAWTAVDNQRWVIGDEFGKLYLLSLLLENSNEVTGWKIDFLGTASRASALVYLDNGYVFIGSHQGDSQVIKLQAQGIEIMQTIPNIAPVLDFTIMDMGNRGGEGQTNEYSSGQARIVTGSGAFQDGSLRSVRSGVGLEDEGVLGDLPQATDLFALKSNDTMSHIDTLATSFVGETRIFRFQSSGEIEESTDYKSFSLSEATLLASNIHNGRLLQVTCSSVRCIDSENGMLVSEWTPPANYAITSGSASKESLAISIGGLSAMTFDLMTDLQVRAQRDFAGEGELSCIHVPDTLPNVCIAGFWKQGNIAILQTKTLQTIQNVVVSEDAVSVPRSILLARLFTTQSPTLFVGMANGEVITFALDPSSLELSQRKVIVLGTQQASFRALPKDDGLVNVFAICEHPSLIYGSEGRIIYSAVTAEKASCVCPFDSEAYPGAVAIATPDDVRIALVDAERTTHVQSLHVGETVRRIAYSTKLKAFGIGTIHRSLRASEEVVKSRFKLADEILFKELDSFELNEEELIESVVRADVREDSGELLERFVIGTAYLDDEQVESIRGRIIVFAVTAERKLKLITELPVKGACRALGAIDGNIVAALVKTVSILVRAL